jgi:hypothetical protein
MSSLFLKSGLAVHLVADLADQELGSLGAGLITVGQVSSSDGQGTSADKIAHSTENLSLVGWVVGDLATVLKVLGVAEKNSADNLVADGGVEVADCSGGKSGTLTVVVVSD